MLKRDLSLVCFCFNIFYGILTYSYCNVSLNIIYKFIYIYIIILKKCIYLGLQHTVEIQRLEQRPIYQCFLCSANVPTAQLLLDHMAGTKHRLAYLVFSLKSYFVFQNLIIEHYCFC